MRSRFEEIVLLSDHRYAVASGILALMTVVVLVPVLTGFAVRNTDPLYYMASALITGNVTLITVVVAINQVILSQELESPGSLRDEIESTASYRQAALDQQTTPTDPSEFLYQLLQQTRDHALSLEDLLPGSTDEVGDRLLTELPEHCRAAGERLESTPDTLSNVLLPILGVDYGDYVHDCHHLQARYEDDDHERLRATLDDLTSDLENLDVARQYFTTLFMKEELATLSRSLLYIAVVAVSTPVALLLLLTTYIQPVPDTPELLALTVLAAVFGLTPLAVLIAFVLRIATFAQHIAGITPFNS